MDDAAGADRKEAKQMNVNLEAVKGLSSYGIRMPILLIKLTRGTGGGVSHRKLNALEHRIAMEIELATESAGRDGWIVQVGKGHERSLYLELVTGDEAEEARGMAVLNQVVAKLNPILGSL